MPEVRVSLTVACMQGNKRKEGGDRFSVDIPGLPKHAVQVTDRGDGTYSLQFVPTHEGTASAHVMLDGAHVRGSPMAVSVHRDVDSLARGALSGALFLHASFTVHVCIACVMRLGRSCLRVGFGGVPNWCNLGYCAAHLGRWHACPTGLCVRYCT